jgi:outer membrane phospholipase A
MQSKEYFKNKARKLAKQTWAGPGKFGVFIVLCIIIVATFESLGLSNREKNLEFRSVQNIVIPVHDKISISEVEQTSEGNTAELHEKLKISTSIDFQKKILERENILLYGAVEQYLFEHKNYIENYENVTSQEEKTKFFLSMIMKQTNETVVEENTFVFDI